MSASVLASETELERLLALVDGHVDLAHCRQVDQRYRATLACAPVDRPPLVVRAPFGTRLQLPPPWSDFEVYPHRQACRDPLAMMQNQLLSSVAPGLLLRDDHPLLIRNDSAILLSAKMYAQQVRPHDARLLQALGGGAQHFCGKGRHLLEPMLETPGLKGFDFGQPWLMDEAWIYERTMAARVPFTNHQPARDQLVQGAARRRFPTGVVFVYEPQDFNDARDVIERYQSV